MNRPVLKAVLLTYTLVLAVQDLAGIIKMPFWLSTGNLALALIILVLTWSPGRERRHAARERDRRFGAAPTSWNRRNSR